MLTTTLITDVVKQFGVHESICISNNDQTYFIQSGDQSFILVQTRMNEEQIKRWEKMFRIAHEKHIRSILPIYPTLDGKLYVKEKQSFYYLTPCIVAQDTCDPTDVMEEIADIHTKSKHTFLIEKNPLHKKYATYKTNLLKKQIELRQMIDLYEQQQYLSPLALQVCSHFHIVDDAIQKGIEHVDAIIKICTEDEHEHIEWSSSICHNRLSMDNVIKKHHVHVKNWEAVTYDNGTTDLIRFFTNEFLRNEFPLDLFAQGLHAYEEKSPLSSLEKHMLIVHILHPDQYVDMLASIRNKNEESHHLQHVISLERIFRVISSGLYVLSTYDQPLIPD